jgi:ATP-dependent Clp protease ATP-binding subunit ClpC
MRMFERFTDRARRVVVLAQEEARMLNHNYIGTEHILLGLIREGEGVAAQVLQKLGAELNRVRHRVMQLMSGHAAPVDLVEEAPVGSRSLERFTGPGHRVLELASESARERGHDAIEPADILLGLITAADGPVVELLASWGVDLTAVRRRIEELAEHEERAEGADSEE